MNTVPYQGIWVDEFIVKPIVNLLMPMSGMKQAILEIDRLNPLSSPGAPVDEIFAIWTTDVSVALLAGIGQADSLFVDPQLVEAVNQNTAVTDCSWPIVRVRQQKADDCNRCEADIANGESASD